MGIDCSGSRLPVYAAAQTLDECTGGEQGVGVVERVDWRTVVEVPRCTPPQARAWLRNAGTAMQEAVFEMLVASNNKAAIC